MLIIAQKGRFSKGKEGGTGYFIGENLGGEFSAKIGYERDSMDWVQVRVSCLSKMYSKSWKFLPCKVRGINMAGVPPFSPGNLGSFM